MQQNELTKTKLLAGDAGAVVSFMPDQTGEYILVIGEEEVMTNGGGNVGVTQDGIALFTAVTAATRTKVDLVGGRGLYCTLGGGASGASVKIGLHKVGGFPRLISSSSSSSSSGT